MVIGRPAPRLLVYPRPAVRRYPPPMPVTVRRPVGVSVDRRRVWPPNVAVVVGKHPIAVTVQVICAVDVLVVVFIVIRTCQAACDLGIAVERPCVKFVREA